MPKPKVISLFKTDNFQNRFLNIPIIGSPKDLFVECRSYELLIPVNEKSEKELNLFEEAVIRMINLKNCSVSDLAETLCLGKDFINFILIRLKENKLLLDNQTLSVEGKEALAKQMNARSIVEYVQGKLFVIKKTGLILPYIHVGEFHSERVDEFDQTSITLSFGSAGSPQIIRGECVHKTIDEDKMNNLLETIVVRKCIKTYNKIAESRKFNVIDLAEGYRIDSSASDTIYFHLKAAVQEGNVDEIMLSDGFVSNIDGITDYIRTVNPTLFSDIKSSAVDMTVMGTEKECEHEIVDKFPEIYSFLKSVEKHNIYLTKSEEDIDRDRIKVTNEAKKQILLDCYYLLEWAFYYYICKNPLSLQMSSLIKKQKVSENAKMLIRFATSIGIQHAYDYKAFFSHIDSNKIYGVYNYRSPKLNICLPLAIAEAKENSASCLHNLIIKDRDFIRFIDRLNLQTGGLRHNANEEIMDVDLDIGRVLSRTKRIIRTILPELNYGKNIPKTDKKNDLSRRRLLAQVSLEKQLGNICFAAMSPGLQNDWLKISPDKRGPQLPDFREYIEILYRILQTEIAEANSELSGKSVLTQDDALKRLGERHDGSIPKSFRKVKESNYIMSTKGGKSTLGAEALVYIANVDKETAVSLEEAEYTAVIDKVVSLRGHAEMIVLNETEQSLDELRSKVIKLTKIIGGYYV